jgi:hypothetical protein
MWVPAAVIAAPAVVSVAATADGAGGFDPTTLIGTVVTPVLVIALILFGKLHTHGEVERLETDLAAERADNAALQAALTDRVVPALTRSTLVLEALDASRFRGPGAGDG